MNDQEMQDWLFERYTNLPEFYREELNDGTFNVRDCCFRLMLMTEEDKDAATAKADKLEEALQKLAEQQLREEMDEFDAENAEWEEGYEGIVKLARSVLYSENV